MLKKPVGKHGSELTYRSVVTSASAAIPFRSLLLPYLGPQVPAQETCYGKEDKEQGQSEQKHASGAASPDAAGVDIGAEEIFVAVPANAASESVRSFGSFTRDLNELADWLAESRIHTVAMESTGVYWIPLYQILETRGFQVFLVNAQHVSEYSRGTNA